jgi:hypothetical protein
VFFLWWLRRLLPLSLFVPGLWCVLAVCVLVFVPQK